MISRTSSTTQLSLSLYIYNTHLQSWFSIRKYLKTAMGEEENLAPSAVNSVAVQKPPHFVLVHGISGGGWCWYKIRCLMENSGFKVTCIDLKGAGIDRSDPNSVLKFDDYNKPLLDFVSSLPENEQVILLYIRCFCNFVLRPKVSVFLNRSRSRGVRLIQRSSKTFTDHSGWT